MFNRKILVSIILVMLIPVISATAFASQEGKSKNVNQRIAGSIFNWIEVTDPATFETGNYAILNLSAKGSPGRANIEVVGQSIPAIEPSGLCPDSTDLELFFDGGFVETFTDQSMLFYVIDDSPDADNALCVDFEGPATAVFDYVITGGTGRFEGASGWATIELTAWSITPVLSAESGEIHGTIQLP